MTNFIQRIIQKKKIKRDFMTKRILQALEKFYLDLAAAKGVVDFLPCFKARIAFHSYIKNDRDLNRVYKNLLKYEKRMAV